jgi:hypothetical protein
MLAVAVAVFAGRTAAADRMAAVRARASVAAGDGKIKAINQFCDGLAPMTKKKERRRQFGLFQKDEEDSGRWVEFKQEAELQAAVKELQVYEVAQVWSREDGALAIWMTLTSGSGDWVHFVEYCFRADGTLARMNSTLNTFNVEDADENKEVNGASRKRDRYFDVDGKQVKARTRITDLKTKRPAPTLQIMDEEEPIYKTPASLPFHDLLKGHGDVNSGAAP